VEAPLLAEGHAYEGLEPRVDLSPLSSPHLAHRQRVQAAQHHGTVGEDSAQLTAERNAIGDRLTVALSADQKAVEAVTNPNKEPVGLMLESLERLDAQARALNQGSQNHTSIYGNNH
jgi:hypothetical protein